MPPFAPINKIITTYEFPLSLTEPVSNSFDNLKTHSLPSGRPAKRQLVRVWQLRLEQLKT